MDYQPVSLRDTIKISRLYTIHYFEYRNDFRFEGEQHNFWEFCFVDKGEVNVAMDGENHILSKGEIAFHKPNEFHAVTATGTSAPNLAVISFACQSRAMRFFENKILHVDETERGLLAKIILEAKSCFAHRLDDPYQNKMEKNSVLPFGTEQFIRLYLEEFLLHIQRRCRMSRSSTPQSRLIKTPKGRSDAETFRRVSAYLEEHLAEPLTVEKICRDNLMGRSLLQKIVREHSGQSLIEYFSNLKVEAAKEMIRMDDMNFTQIAEKLGYTSIHYFSRQFKQITGMTPSEYASSIKALAEGILR